MNTKIAIPTDFTVESLNTLKLLIGNANEGDQYDVVLLHGAYLSDSITEMLFFSKGKMLKKFENEAFVEACRVIQQAKQIRSLRVDLFTGYNIRAFNMYLEGNKIDEIAVPANYKFKFPSRKSFDLIPLIKKCDAQITEVSWNRESVDNSQKNSAEIYFGVTN